MLKSLNEWAPALTLLSGLLVGLGGLQITLYNNLSADIRTLTASMSDVRERLAVLETRMGHVEAKLEVPLAPGAD